jgi:hypothetical protein
MEVSPPIHRSSGLEHVYKKLDYFYTSKHIPHIIFHGSPGSGKRTIVQDFLFRIYNGDKHNLKTNVMTVNCSHGKGIKFVREDLKNFAKTNIQKNNGVFFKSIVLFNADSLTIDAQSALRRCIELFSNNTRFFMVVENKHNLLNPILSRFCELYIPEPFINSHFVNLHTLSLQKEYTIDTSKKDQEMKCMIVKIHDDIETTVPPHCVSSYFIDMATELYTQGFSTLDFIQAIETMEEGYWTEKEKVILVMCFQKIKSEFRCEKLLLFYMLDFCFFRSNQDLKNISSI